MSPKPNQSLFSLLVLGSRPRTLPAAVVPVVVGAACIEDVSSAMWWKISLALVVSLSLQVAVNFANDYSDGIRGTDDDRVGPLRLVGSGLLPASTVKRAAFATLFVAAASGFVLAAVSSWFVLLVGAAAMVSAWTYTGGPRPYGYAGLGELFVFVFFGLVATMGTQYVVATTITLVGFFASVAVGAFACALLVVNNLRDRHGDSVVGKRTLAVVMGDRLTRVFFASLFAVAGACVVVVVFLTSWWAGVGLIGVGAAIPAVIEVLHGAQGRDLIAVLGKVGRAQLFFGGSFGIGLLVHFL